MPTSEGEAAQSQGEEEQRALAQLERARHRVRVADKKLALIAEAPDRPSDRLTLPERMAAASGLAEPSALRERRLERAWTDVAEAEVYLEDAEREYRAIQRRRAAQQEGN